MPAWVRATYGRRRARSAEVFTSPYVFLRRQTQSLVVRSPSIVMLTPANAGISLLVAFGAQAWPIQAGYRFRVRGSALALRDYASRFSNSRLRSTPHRYPEMSPSRRITRWQGMATAI